MLLPRNRLITTYYCSQHTGQLNHFTNGLLKSKLTIWRLLYLKLQNIHNYWVNSSCRNNIQNSELENLQNQAHPSLRQQVSHKQVPSLLQLCATFVFHHFNTPQTPQHKSCGCPCHEKPSIKL
ncbi:hypothetical protein Droror1_Dr00000774 [Drosera rotundifolia]